MPALPEIVVLLVAIGLIFLTKGAMPYDEARSERNKHNQFDP